jgi:hypothetical protein
VARRQHLRRLALVVLLAASLAPAAPVRASELVGEDASGVTLAADDAGRALVTFTSGGAVHHVLASGAVDARPPSTSAPQVAFNLSTSGGTVRNSCSPVKLPLAWLVTACRAADGSYWALQSWQRLLPNGGAQPSPSQAVRELRLSHWTGATADLTVRFGWSYHKYLQLYGRYSYRGEPVFGYSVRSGVPQDAYGRNVYVDALGSDLGSGWERVNSFLAHSPLGGFCYGFFPHAGGTGVGTRFRATVIGPGVTPDVVWEGSAPARYSAAADLAADADLGSLLKGDPLCRPN